jgi:hypothetical protein
MANSSMFVLPSDTAPASASRFTTVASYGETKLSSMRDPQLVLTSSVQKMSLCAIGTPVKGVALPAAILASACSACRSAFSSVTVTKALRAPSKRLMRSRKCSVISRDETARFASAAERAARVCLCMVAAWLSG